MYLYGRSCVVKYGSNGSEWISVCGESACRDWWCVNARIDPEQINTVYSIGRHSLVGHSMPSPGKTPLYVSHHSARDTRVLASPAIWFLCLVLIRSGVALVFDSVLYRLSLLSSDAFVFCRFLELVLLCVQVKSLVPPCVASTESCPTWCTSQKPCPTRCHRSWVLSYLMYKLEVLSYHVPQVFSLALIDVQIRSLVLPCATGLESCPNRCTNQKSCPPMCHRSWVLL